MCTFAVARSLGAGRARRGRSRIGIERVPRRTQRKAGESCTCNVVRARPTVIASTDSANLRVDELRVTGCGFTLVSL